MAKIRTKRNRDPVISFVFVKASKRLRRKLLKRSPLDKAQVKKLVRKHFVGGL